MTISGAEYKRVCERVRNLHGRRAERLSPEDMAARLDALDAFERNAGVQLELVDYLEGATNWAAASEFEPSPVELGRAAARARSLRVGKPSATGARGEAYTPAEPTISDQRAKIHRGLWWEVMNKTIATAPAFDDPDLDRWWRAEVDRRMLVEHGIAEMPKPWRRGAVQREDARRSRREAEPVRAEVIAHRLIEPQETRGELIDRLNAALRGPAPAEILRQARESDEDAA